jgi:hypothetical protein
MCDSDRRKEGGRGGGEIIPFDHKLAESNIVLLRADHMDMRPVHICQCSRSLVLWSM